MKRILAIFLVLSMLLGALPSFAESDSEPIIEEPITTPAPEGPTKPVEPEKPAETEVPETGKESVGTKEPETTDEPEAIKEPDAVEDPEVTEEPEAPVVPEAIVDPETTEESETTDEPEASENPEASEESEMTEEPEATEESEVTEEPEVIDAPEATEEPAEVVLTGETDRVDNSTDLPAGEYDTDFFDVYGSGAQTISCRKVFVSGGKAEAEILISGSCDSVKANGGEYSPSHYSNGGNFRIPVVVNDETSLYVVFTDDEGQPAETGYSICVCIADMNGVATLEEPVVSESDAPVDNSTALPDNAYVPADGNFSFEGGSGRTSFFCPKVTVSGGKAVATLVVKSTTYDYFKVGGVQYSTSAYDAESVYADIPVVLNGTTVVKAHSTKMNTEIEYKIRVNVAETDIDQDAPAGDEEFVITKQEAVLKDGVITVTIATSAASYDKIYLGAAGDDQTNASYIQGTANVEGSGYTFTFELTSEALGKTISFVPVKADNSWYTGAQCQITIPADLADAGAGDEEALADGEYEVGIESDFSMFKITSRFATVKDGVLTVTIGTSKNTYDKFHIGSYADRDENGGYSSYVQGVKKDGEDGYTFTFTLSKDMMGKTLPFVPGKPDGTWYAGKNYTQQYYLTVPVVSSTDKVLDDGNYGVSIESDFSMFKITSQSAAVKNGVVTVTIGTSKNTYDKIHFGAYAESYTEYVQGVKKDGEDGYTFTFTLSKDMMGKTLPFVPGKPDGTWYAGGKNGTQYYLTIPTVSDDNKLIDDGKYETNIESGFSMFKITSQSATVKDGNVTVTIGTSKNTYDKIHFGVYAESYTEYVQGVKKDGKDGYTFTFTLSKDMMGKTLPFVPGKPDGTWYAGGKNGTQYYLTIPAALGNVIAPDEGEEDGNGYADGDYTANAETWVGFKLKSTKIKVNGDTMEVTLLTSQVSYDAMYLGSVDDVDKSDIIQGKLVNGNSAMQFTFTLPVSALGTKVPFALRENSGSWWKYQQNLTLPAALDAAVPEQDVDINSYVDGEYTGETLTYTKTEINGEEAFNNNAAFSPVSTKIVVKGDKLEITFTCNSADKVSYPHIFFGGKDAAANASEAELIAAYTTPSSVAGGVIPHYTFELPRSALGQMITFSAYSRTGEKWYEFAMRISDRLVADAVTPEPDQPGENEGALPGDGDYTTTVETGAAMFKVVSCVLTVKDGKAFAKVALSGTGYDKLFMGTAEAAKTAPESDMIGYTVNADGKYEFIVPVSALDTPIAVASHSVKNDTWYDRSMTFKSEGMEKLEEKLEDGDYNTSVETGAAMFKVIACVLHVKAGVCTADITLSGTGYDKLYMGTAENAANASESEVIGYTENAEGKYVFTIPVSALDTPIALASHSIKNDVWYDRIITISSKDMEKIDGSGTPDGGEKPGEGDEEITEPEKKPESDLSGSTGKVDSSTALADGTYTPDKFSWSGGSGRVSLSCNKVVVENGKAYAYIVFSSPDYAYVKANGQKIYGSHGGGTTTFKVPVNLNANNRILGMTTKMTANYEIAYTIYVYIAGAKDFGEVSEEAKEAEIIGLNYDSAVEVENSKLFKAYRYEDGFIVIDVADVGRYLLTPEGVEVPVGLDEEAIIIQLPVQSVYAADSFILEMLEGLQNEEAYKRITAVGMEHSEIAFVANGLEDGTITYAGDSAAPDYAALLKTSCDIAILPAVFAVEENEEINEATATMIAEVNERLTLLGIPAFVDRSADEETEAGRLEWIKVYGMILGCEEEANALFEKLAAELTVEEAAA